MTDITPNVLGTITITVTDQSVQYDTGAFSLPDLIFWMEVVKDMILSSVTGNTSNPVEEYSAALVEEPKIVAPKRTASPLG